MKERPVVHYCIERKNTEGNYTGLFFGVQCNRFHVSVGFDSALKFSTEKSAQDFLVAFRMAWGRPDNVGVTDHQYFTSPDKK